MPNPSWPVALPQAPLIEGFSEIPSTMVQRSPAREGFPAKRRRVVTEPVRTYSMAMALTGIELAALQTFFESTCEGGAIPFDWTDHITGAARTYYYLAINEITALAPDGPFRVSFQLESLPS